MTNKEKLQIILVSGGNEILNNTAENERRVAATGNPCCGALCAACPFNYTGIKDVNLREYYIKRQTKLAESIVANETIPPFAVPAANRLPQFAYTTEPLTNCVPDGQL